MCTTSGRITYPDDEIVFQTTESLWERGSLAITGIAMRTGEKPSRPSGTFGWAEGTDGRRYGIFGHAQSLVALPFYGLGRVTADEVPVAWTRAVRSDLLSFHPRSPRGDWLRMLVSLTNCVITALAAILLASCARVLGCSSRPALALALVYALGTTAWPYTKTLLSEPLSGLVLLFSTWAVLLWRKQRRATWLAVAAFGAGLSAHVHLLNLAALPCLLGLAAAPSFRSRAWGAERRAWLLGLGVGGVMLALLGIDHALRFGSPFETGRHDHYGHWVLPFEGLMTMLIAPGRSVFIYSPPIVLGLFALPRLRERDGDLAWFIGALALARLVLVACRSDWHGGWGVGPRYLVPLVPFLLLPLFVHFERWRVLPARWRRVHLGVIASSIVLQAWLAMHSIFQVMWTINQTHGRVRYWRVADWQLEQMPPIAYVRLEGPTIRLLLDGQWAAARGTAQVDMLALGAARVAAGAGEVGLVWLFVGVGVVTVVAGLVLAHLARAAQSPSGT